MAAVADDYEETQRVPLAALLPNIVERVWNTSPTSQLAVQRQAYSAVLGGGEGSIVTGALEAAAALCVTHHFHTHPVVDSPDLVVLCWEEHGQP